MSVEDEPRCGPPLDEQKWQKCWKCSSGCPCRLLSDQWWNFWNKRCHGVHTVKKSTHALLVNSKDAGIEVNAKFVVLTRDQNAGRTHNIKIDNSSFERVEEFRYLGTTQMNQNSVQEEIKSRL